MRVLMFIADLFNTTGGGQSFFADTIRAHPDYEFYYFTSAPIAPTALPANVRALPICDIYRKHRGGVHFGETDLSIEGCSLGGREDEVLYIFDLAASAIGHRFDIVEIPDFLGFGALVPFALQHVGVDVDRVVVSMHGTISQALTDNWDENLNFDKAGCEVTEELLFRSADIRYGIGPGYVTEWQQTTGCPAILMDLASIIDLPAYRKNLSRYRRDAQRSGGPAVAFVGRQEKWKGPDLFVELVAGLSARVSGEALIVGPPVTIGEVSSRRELDRMAARRRLSLNYIELPRAELLDTLATSDWVTVLPSRHDTTNLVAIESLLSGCPTMVSRRAGACDVLDRMLPGLPYDKIDPDNLGEARAQLFRLIENYDARRDELRRYLESAELHPTGRGLPAVYQTEPTPHAASREKLAQLFEPLAAYVEERVVERALSDIRDKLETGFADMFPEPKSPQRERFVTLFDNTVHFRRIADRCADEIAADGAPAALADRDFTKLTREMLPFCFSGNRVATYEFLAELERRRGNDLLYATYQIRAMRLSGTSNAETLRECCAILEQHKFPDEALVVRALYGPTPDDAAALDYLRATSLRFREPPPEDFAVRVDRRSLDQPKVSVIVSMYNVADKFPAFLRGLLGFTEVTRRGMELILVDSNSSDETHDVVLGELDRAQAGGEAISTLYVRTPTRETIQRAWNRGIALSRGAYLAFLGVDEMNRPDALDLMADYLDRRTGIDWVQGTALVTEVNKSGGFVRDVMPYNRVFDNCVMHYLDTCFIGYVGALYRRSLHDRVGYYDDRFRAAGDTEFKNRALPHMRVATIPECLGFFWNYPEERTTHSPTAEIEDIRAWYLYRSVAGMMYAFDGSDGHDAVELFFRCLDYRKSYMEIDCTDLELACAVAQYLARRRDFSFRAIAGHAPGAHAARDIYRLLDSLGVYTAQIGGVRFLYELGGVLENAGYALATTIRGFLFLPQPARLEFTNDNRSHQHHMIWPSEAPHIHPKPENAVVGNAAEGAISTPTSALRIKTASNRSNGADEDHSAADPAANPLLRARRWIRDKVHPSPVLIDLGDRARATRDWKEAAAFYQQALESDPQRAAIWVQFGHALKEQGQRAQAEAAYRRSLALEGGVADTHLQLGHVLKLLGRRQEAAQSYLSALRLDVDLTDARRELARLGYTRAQIAAAMTAGLLPPTP